MANNKEKEPKNKKRFFKDFKAEIKKVIWPTPKQLVNNTLAVVVIVIITAAIVFALDFAFELINKYGINKFKSSIRSDLVVEENIHNHEHENETTDENTVENQVNETNNTLENTAVENNTVEDVNNVENNVNE